MGMVNKDIIKLIFIFKEIKMLCTYPIRNQLEFI